MDFYYLILMGLMVIFIVSQHCLLRRHAQARREPLNTAQVEHPLHVEVIQSELDGISLAYRCNWLDIWTTKHLSCQAAVDETSRGLQSPLVLHLSLLLIFVKPYHSIYKGFDYVQFKVSRMLSPCSLCLP